jgi:antitoxin PrlF
MSVTVTSKGQVTVPKQVRDRLGIKPGSKVDFEIAEDGRAFLRNLAHSVARSATNSRCRSAGDIIASCIVTAMRRRGGKSSSLIQRAPPERCGSKRINAHNERVDAA